jgi:hypothetical protein
MFKGFDQVRFCFDVGELKFGLLITGLISASAIPTRICYAVGVGIGGLCCGVCFKTGFGILNKFFTILTFFYAPSRLLLRCKDPYDDYLVYSFFYELPETTDCTSLVFVVFTSAFF